VGVAVVWFCSALGHLMSLLIPPATSLLATMALLMVGAARRPPPLHHPSPSTACTSRRRAGPLCVGAADHGWHAQRREPQLRRHGPSPARPHLHLLLQVRAAVRAGWVGRPPAECGCTTAPCWPTSCKPSSGLRARMPPDAHSHTSPTPGAPGGQLRS
jgi:hypothetical protein